MKRAAILLACAVVLACASQSSDNVQLAQPDLELVQLVGPADRNFPPGYIEVQYGVRIANRSGEPLTLRRIDLEPAGSGGGPYRLRRETYRFEYEIAPGQFRDFTFWAKANATASFRSVDAYAPVSIRGVAHFDSPSGPVKKIFLETLRQERSGRSPSS